MSVSQFLHAALGYWCRFRWYNSRKGTNSGGKMLVMADHTNCLLISASQVFFFLLYLYIASVGVKKIQKEAKERESERGETEVRVSDWEYGIWDFGFVFFFHFLISGFLFL